MKQIILKQFPWPWMPTLALVIFFTFFVGLLFFISMKTRQAAFASASALPLDEGIPLMGGTSQSSTVEVPRVVANENMGSRS